MKKFLAILFAAMMLFTLASCEDGKCDAEGCTEEAIENDEAISGVKGEYCTQHMMQEMGKAVGEAINALTE